MISGKTFSTIAQLESSWDYIEINGTIINFPFLNNNIENYRPAILRLKFIKFHWYLVNK